MDVSNLESHGNSGVLFTFHGRSVGAHRVGEQAVVTSALVGVATDLVVPHNTAAVVDGRHLDGGVPFIRKARIGTS